MNISFLNNLKSDIPASIVVFFAIPLCLGIVSASSAPLFLDNYGHYWGYCCWSIMDLKLEAALRQD